MSYKQCREFNKRLSLIIKKLTNNWKLHKKTKMIELKDSKKNMNIQYQNYRGHSM